MSNISIFRVEFLTVYLIKLNLNVKTPVCLAFETYRLHNCIFHFHESIYNNDHFSDVSTWCRSKIWNLWFSEIDLTLRKKTLLFQAAMHEGNRALVKESRFSEFQFQSGQLCYWIPEHIYISFIYLIDFSIYKYYYYVCYRVPQNSPPKLCL